MKSVMLKRTLIALIALVLVALIEAMWFRVAPIDEIGDDEDQAIAVPERIVAIDGERLLALDTRAQVQNDIVTAHPRPGAEILREQLKGEARDTSALPELRARFLRARAAAPALAAAIRDTIAQRYGASIAAAVDSAKFDAVYARTRLLLDLPYPANHAPYRLSVTVDGRHWIATRLAQTERSGHWFYGLDAKSGISPGTTVPLATFTRSRLGGVIVPVSAIVWHDGVAWCYRKQGPGLYKRVSLARGTAQTNGDYRTETLTTRDEIVVRGAQLLLSEELRARIQTEG